jgi:transposase-like protein
VAIVKVYRIPPVIAQNWHKQKGATMNNKSISNPKCKNCGREMFVIGYEMSASVYRCPACGKVEHIGGAL